MLFYIIAISVILMDQISKILVRTHIDMYERFTWLGIEFTHIENSGMAGGLFPGYARVFGVVAVVFVIGVFYLRRTEDWNGPLINSSLGLLVGGAVGNGIDRLLFGEVTDFIVRSGGVLNIADHALELGIVLLIIYVVVDWLKSKNWIFKKEINKKERIAMIAIIEKTDQENTAVYKRQINHSVAAVWSYLTENEKLQQWFSELEMKDLKPGGEIHFNFGDGNHELIDILDVEPNKLLVFTWPPKNTVRIELNETEHGCELIFKEILHEVDEHTARDLTGWHVCLDVIEALLDGKTIDDRKSEWESHYPAYQELLRAAGL